MLELWHAQAANLSRSAATRPKEFMKINEKALQEAAAKLRKLRLTDVGGRKEHPADTVKSVFERGLGGMYDDEAITYALRAGVRYYLEAAEHLNAGDGAVCTHDWAYPPAKCPVCGLPVPPTPHA